MIVKSTFILATASVIVSCAPGTQAVQNTAEAAAAGSGSRAASAAATLPSVTGGNARPSVTQPNPQTNAVPAAGNTLPPPASPGTGNAPTTPASPTTPSAPGTTPITTTPTATASPAGSGPRSNGTDPVIPQPVGDCPAIKSGGFTFMGLTSQLWVGTKGSTPAPMMIYWHGTGGSAVTATAELDGTLVQEIMGQGGVIASITEGLKGDTLDWGVFTTGDYQTVDQIVACSVKQLNIDPKRIYASGASAGGLAAGELVYGRSSYMAGALPNSGGQGGYPMNMILQDPTHVPAVMTMHGARGVDVVVIDFGDSSLREDIDIAKHGGFAVDCDHGGGHVGAPADLKAAGWDFLKKHPFGFGTSPYAAGLPATYPKYCMIVTKDTPMPMMMTMGGTGAMPPKKP